MPMPGDPGYAAKAASTLASSVAAAVDAVRSRLAAACVRSGRDPASVALLAVTKFNPPEAVDAAYAAGVRLFGENRVQEAESKFAARAERYPGSFVHLLGHLQSNKARRAVELFDCVQSVDSTRILEELGRRAEAAGKTFDVLFELHTGEESKSGFPDADSLLAALDSLGACPALVARGVMTMAPYTDDMDAVRASFRACRAAYEAARERRDLPRFDILSMGMTNDFEVAVEEGSTMVRIGTAIFGPRTVA